VLTAGRAVGFAVAFAIPLVLARHLTLEEFGTYKYLFLLAGTLSLQAARRDLQAPPRRSRGP
jgi:hypothetical protein